MFTRMKKRKYQLKQRAAQQEETRNRIVEAAVALHEELGPRAATVSAIAERAGVQRLTYYRHFPDMESLFRACTSHWLSLNPPPALDAWAHIADPAERTSRALRSLYAYYRATAGMWAATYRDLEQVPALHEPMAGVESYLEAVRRDLYAAWSGRGAPRGALGAALRLVLHFRGWQMLSEQGLDDAAITDAAVCWLQALHEARSQTRVRGQRRTRS